MTSKRVEVANGSCAENLLRYDDCNHQTLMLSSLNTLRKGGLFCDVKFVVEQHEIPAHSAVVAAASTWLFELLTTNKDKTLLPTMYELAEFDYKSFQHLVNYIYTGRLVVPHSEVKAVYKAANRLRMASAAKACTDFLVAYLSPTNCLDVCGFADDPTLRERVNQFIQNRITEVALSKKFLSLPCVQVEVIGTDETLLSSSNDRHLFCMVLNWAKTSMDSSTKGTLESLTEQVNILYLDVDNTLQDCKDMDDSSIEGDDLALDYKKMSKRKQLTIQKPKIDSNSNSPNPVKKFSVCNWPELEQSWSIIASYQTADRTFMAVALLNGTLATMSLHFRPTPPISPDSSASEGSESPVHTLTHSRLGSIERHVSLTPLTPMSTARCGFGLAVLSNMLVACGGYGRGECLKTMESYDLLENKWKSLPDMKIDRGRFAVAVLNGKLYACGGSDGHDELCSVECYDPQTGKWNFVKDMLTERSYPGVAALNGKLYCISGCIGQRCIGKCEVYSPATGVWQPIASLGKGHFQAAVCSFQGKIFAIGGSDGWNCLSKVTVYDPQSNCWMSCSSLNIPRRGAGVDIVNDKIIVVGGNDGTHSLKSTEIYDVENECWHFGPQLSIARANVGVACLKQRLFAVGGFSGKKFLDSLEYLDVEGQEWCSYLPVDDVSVNVPLKITCSSHNGTAQYNVLQKKSKSKSQQANVWSDDGQKIINSAAAADPYS